jgi:tetratricopeptide (TPR) repeat protein
MLKNADRKQLDEIAFVLADRSKPTLVLIAVGSYRKRDALRAELTRLLPAYRSALLDLSGHPITSLFRAIRERASAEVLNSQPGEYLLHICGIEESLLVSRDGKLAPSPLIAELNLERENLFHEFPCCLIVWTTLHFTDKLRAEAPDLWDWITYNYHFLDDHCDAVVDEIPLSRSAPVGVTDERKKRITELEERIQSLQLDGVEPERVLRTKLSLHKALGAEYLGAFRYGDAIRCYTAALALLGQMSHARIDEAEIFYRLGGAHLAARHFAEALTSYEESLRIQKQTGDHNNIGGTWHQIGMVYEEQRLWPQALESYQKALEWKEKTGKNHEKGGTWHQIGRVYEEQRLWPQALESYQKALEWQEKTGQNHELGSTWHQIGTVYAEQRLWSQALESYHKALEWKEKTGQNHKLGGTWHQIGMTYAEQRLWPQALESYQKALDWKEKTGQNHELGSTWHQIGRVYEEQRQWSLALENYNKALEWYEKTGQHHQLGNTRHQIGMVYEEQQQWPLALESYHKALQWYEKTGQHHQLGGTWHQIGMVYEEQKDFSAALQSYLQAWELCSATAMSHHVAIVRQSLSRLFSTLPVEERTKLKKTLPEELRELLADTKEE